MHKQYKQCDIPLPEDEVVPLDDPDPIKTSPLAALLVPSLEATTTFPLLTSPEPEMTVTSPPVSALPPPTISREPPTEPTPVDCPAARYMLPPTPERPPVAISVDYIRKEMLDSE